MAGRGIIAAVVFGVLAAGPARAGEVCDVDRLVVVYEAAVADADKGDIPSYLAAIRPLAHMGIGPAQRRLARAYADGVGVAKDLPRALLWAWRAERAGDATAAAEVQRLSAALTAQRRESVEERSRAWRPDLPECWHRAPPPDGLYATHRYRLSGFRVQFDETIPADVIRAMVPGVARVLRAAVEETESGRWALAVADRIEVLASRKYDRYTGFAPTRDEDVLQISIAAFFDTEPGFTAAAAVAESVRRVYGKLPDAPFAGPWERSYKGKRLVGSPYPDARNTAFFETVAKVLDIAEGLPPALRRTVRIVDEIRYNPPSAYFLRGGLADNTVGFYDAQLGEDGRRIIFVRRDMRFSSPLGLLLTVVHEGTHALQDRTAEKYDVALPALRKELADLRTGGAGDGPAARAVEARIAERQDYLTRFRGGRIKDGRAEVLDFECEAVLNEVATARHLGADPSVIESSGYIDLCDEAQVMLVKWKDERFLKGLKLRK